MSRDDGAEGASKGAPGHVAEYFAVLGVGDELVWKHRQKQQFASADAQAPDDEDEEEALLEERFMREIVDVRIVRILEGDELLSCAVSAGAGSAALNRQQQQHNKAGPISAISSNSTDFSHDSVTLLSSPSNSETNALAVPDRLSRPPHDSVTPYRGWDLLLKTLPAERAGIFSHAPSMATNDPRIGPLWSKNQVLDANLDWSDGLHGKLLDRMQRLQSVTSGPHAHLNVNGIVRRVESTLRNLRHRRDAPEPTQHYHLAYRRRSEGDCDRPAVVDVQLRYMRLHRSCLQRPLQYFAHEHQQPMQSQYASKAGALIPNIAGQLMERYQSQMKDPRRTDVPSIDAFRLVQVQDYLQLPDGYDEWAIPEEFTHIRDPSLLGLTVSPATSASDVDGGQGDHIARTVVVLANEDEKTYHRWPQDSQKAYTDHSQLITGIDRTGSGSGVGVEVDILSSHSEPPEVDMLVPKLLSNVATAYTLEHDSDEYLFVPILAIQRQRIDEEERFHEADTAIVDLAVSWTDQAGAVVLPLESGDCEDADDDKNDGVFQLLGKTNWDLAQRMTDLKSTRLPPFGLPAIIARRNISYGFADVAFATRVLGRFPYKNYQDFPLPEEELPMFCYPTGCRLHRARFSDAPLAEYYGFVVKNEHGDNIYISCVSFMEPLTSRKINQMNDMSEKRRRTSLSHRAFCESRERKKGKCLESDETGSEASTAVDSSFLLTGFDDMTTFEKKTICLVSRFPFWTAFRKFLSHLHILSGSTSNLPLERHISHLLLSVPVPKPGGASILVPLPALNDPLVLHMPPEKDFPLVDLPFQRLVACLDIKTIVTVVLGLLALERKVIIMSSRPSLVLDVCELLRSLLFPFELCAPYVPRLTEPFKNTLDFPGALFVGIHRDGTEEGLAEAVRRSPPEDSIVIDLDTGDMTCDGGRNQVISAAWDTIPAGARSLLVSELETLCGDAGIVDGQEPLDSQYDSAFDVALPVAVDGLDHALVEDSKPLDDRAIRDAFLRFFCYVLGGYERYLIVPDADFLRSGDEWFDSQAFLDSVAEEKKGYLSALISTQLFQSFIQRRTEASDVHCLLFDESLAEFHSSSIPYGRLGGDVESVLSGEKSDVLFSLLIDQSAALPPTDPLMLNPNRSMDASEAESSINMSRASGGDCPYAVKFGEWAMNAAGDFVTAPSRQGLHGAARFSYCVDGNPCFPHIFDAKLFLPLEPESWLIETAKVANPLLARTERELEEATRRRRMATSFRGLQNQRRCMWQLPKLMGSHFLGAWLLCIPVQVSQANLSNEQQSRFLMRAFGALRLLRSKQRIVPDEAAYRALMVACGRSQSDRRLELEKLFGLLRSDGIFPSAVTLGQYTKALAEGYSKRQESISQDEDFAGIEVTESSSNMARIATSPISSRCTKDKDGAFIALDTNVVSLEWHGRRWRQRSGTLSRAEDEMDRKSGIASRSWLPVAFSSSFVPCTPENDPFSCESEVIAIWSRTRSCSGCSYIPLEEEVMAGWDVVAGENEIPGAVACPRCGSFIIPMLGYKEMTLDEALNMGGSVDENLDCSVADFGALPPQIGPVVNQYDDVSYVAYISPASLRLALEHYVEEYGEEILNRDRLKALDSEIFYNFWWQCARFSLPLPLPVSSHNGAAPRHSILFAAWDYSVAERGCKSGAAILKPFLERSPDQPFDEDIPRSDAFDVAPLLFRFHLQGFYSTVWDHVDLSKVLVKLVEACDKRDFQPVVEAVIDCNRRRLALYTTASDDAISEAHAAVKFPIQPESSEHFPSVELDVYRTILYLAKYQCTTAFHSFFPATVKPCKGYHFWCAIGTPLPMFDRLIRDAVKRANNGGQSVITPSREVSDVALGFRCVFGHLI